MDDLERIPRRGEIHDIIGYDESSLDSPPNLTESNHDEDAFARGYIECALWSSSEEDANGDEVNFDSISDQLETQARIKLDADAKAFFTDHRNEIEEWCLNVSKGYDYAGQALWLNSHEHGSGFWDTDAGGVEKSLDNAARAFGKTCGELYLGDDEKIHLTTEEDKPPERGEIHDIVGYDETVHTDLNQAFLAIGEALASLPAKKPKKPH